MGLSNNFMKHAMLQHRFHIYMVSNMNICLWHVGFGL